MKSKEILSKMNVESNKYWFKVYCMINFDLLKKCNSIQTHRDINNK